MEKKAKAIGAPVQTLIIKNAGHNRRKVDADISPTRPEIVEASAKFFVDHLKK